MPGAQAPHGHFTDYAGFPLSSVWSLTDHAGCPGSPWWLHWFSGFLSSPWSPDWSCRGPISFKLSSQFNLSHCLGKLSLTFLPLLPSVPLCWDRFMRIELLMKWTTGGCCYCYCSWENCRPPSQTPHYTRQTMPMLITNNHGFPLLVAIRWESMHAKHTALHSNTCQCITDVRTFWICSWNRHGMAVAVVDCSTHPPTHPPTPTPGAGEWYTWWINSFSPVTR